MITDTQKAQGEFHVLVKRIRSIDPGHRFLRLITLLDESQEYGPAVYCELCAAAHYALRKDV